MMRTLSPTSNPNHSQDVCFALAKDTTFYNITCTRSSNPFLETVIENGNYKTLS